MRIVLVASMYPPEIGGPATYAKLLVERLPSLGISVDLILFRDVRTLPRGVRHIVYAWKVFSHARKADLVFVQDTVSTGLPAALASFVARRPLLVRVPGDYAWEQGAQRFGITDTIDDFQNRSYGIRMWMLRAVQKFVVRRAAAVIVPSKYFRSIVAKWGVKSNRLHVIYNSIDLESAVLPKVRPDGPTMVSVGRFVPWKGFDVLIELLRELPTWNLVLIGDGPQRRHLEEKARSLGVYVRTIFTGKLSRAEVFGWYKAADVFALNTSFESFSYQTAEALSFGIPIIATNIGSLPELVENGKEGVLVKPNDKEAIKRALESVILDKAAWKQRIEAGKRKAALFDPAEMLQKFVAVCTEIV